MQPSEEQLKNKIELWDDLVICEHGESLTSVFWCGNECPKRKHWTWVKYVTPISPWDNWDEYKESIRVSLGVGSKIEFNIDNEWADCIFIPRLDSGLPAIQEEYTKIMQ